ncbi:MULTISPECIES: dipeptidase [unclassified Polaribacter]|uniref:dipeptidase n=1 Tax=unclassified Polaribacter TaxID=196858 RepID=UPI001C501858|nr:MULTISPECIES: membrane dipeptidase [unclassified Polaribacter]QXP64309.1 membrane dipeptidase [Polaribacter sp. HaHaR_3_91]QXP66812.1 membrane dipeptidase [Polaribacter sp. AHE13PA]QXP68912.1 membrane dipeptidase [Polaribacter sp. R2A056_3_33]
MEKNRRNLIKLLSIGTIFPTQIASTFASILESVDINPNQKISNNLIKNLQDTKIEELYKKAMVIDGLIIPKGWNKDSFDALAKTGYSGFGTSLLSGNLKSALKNITEWDNRIKNNSDVLIKATSAADFIRAKKENKTAVLYGFQNATMMEKSIKNLDTLYDAGTRWIQLTYNQRNLLGDGSTERTDCGLSDFGIEAIERMNELGIMIDLSHCGKETTNDGIKFSKTGACFNHTMCESLYKNHPRSKTDAQIKAMADKGGIMGVICLGYMIGPELGTKTTLETYVDHIDHVVKIAGIDHVGVAADFAIQGLQATGATKENWYVPRLTKFKPSYKVQWPPWIPELDKPDRYLQVAKILDKRGYSTGDIEKILGLNWLRYFKDTLKS